MNESRKAALSGESAGGASAAFEAPLAGAAAMALIIALICGAQSALGAEGWAFWRELASLAMGVALFALGAGAARRYLPDFIERGALVGAARVAYQAWRVYWLYIGASLVAAALLSRLGDSGALADWGFGPLFAEDGVVRLIALSYLPEDLILLPLAAAALAMGIAILALGARSPSAALMIAIALFLAASQPWAALQGEAAPRPLGAGWPANPFAWQLYFVLGAAFAARWLPIPAPDRRLAAAAALYLVGTAAILISGEGGAAPAWPLGPARLLATGAALYLGAFAIHRLGLDFGWIGREAQRIGESPYAALGLVATLTPVLASFALSLGGGALAHLAMALLGAALLAALTRAAAFFLAQPWREPPLRARPA